MKKYKVICFINSAGINVILKNIEDTMNSIKNNINVEFGFYICTDTEDRKKTIDNIVKKNNLSNVVIEIVVKTKSWAKNFNEFFIKYKDDADYILCSHDDLIIRTFDFFNITMNEISGHEDEIGWIAYTSDSYYRISNISVCQTAREMFCKDRFTWPKTYELHKMETSYNKDYLDMPQRNTVRHFTESGIYHVYNRGVEKRDVVISDDDRMRFVHSLYIFNDSNNAPNCISQPKQWQSNTNRKCIVRIHAWCLMNNHYHLLLSPVDGELKNISLFMKKLNMGYAKFFNEKQQVD